MAERKSLRTMSELPEGIMHQILSLLEAKDALRASLMSKAWFSAWLTKPNLLFKDYDFSSENLAKNMTNLLRYQEEKIGIDRLEIDLDDRSEMHPDATVNYWNNWIRVAVENGVKSIKYFLFADSLDLYNLSPIVFQGELLVDIQLRSFELEGIEDMRCHNLKKLGLYGCCFDELIFEKILSSFKLIDHLYAENCYGFGKLKVTNLPKLKRLELFSPIDCSIEVESSSLEYFNSVSEDKMSSFTLHACPKLKTLRLQGFGNVSEFFSNLACKLPQLEDLEINLCLLPQTIRISSDSVKKIKLTGNSELQEIEIDTPSLDCFKFKGKVIPEFNFKAVSSLCIYKIKKWPYEQM